MLHLLNTQFNLYMGIVLCILVNLDINYLSKSIWNGFGIKRSYFLLLFNRIYSKIMPYCLMTNCSV